MPIFVAKTCYLTVNGVDLSANVKSATLTISQDALEATTLGPTTTAKGTISGLYSWQLEVEFYQNYDVGAVNATLWGALGTSVPITYRPTSGAKSATNPEYSGQAVLESFPVISNSAGELASCRVTFKGNGALTRSTS